MRRIAVLLSGAVRAKMVAPSALANHDARVPADCAVHQGAFDWGVAPRNCDVGREAVRSQINGGYVVGAQWHLQGAGFLPENGVDGFFGNGSHEALLNFQRTVGVVQSGFVRTDTWNIMRRRTLFVRLIYGGSEATYNVENRSDELFHRRVNGTGWYVFAPTRGIYKSLGISDM